MKLYRWLMTLRNFADKIVYILQMEVIMKKQLPTIILGLVLIIAGIYAMLNQLGYLEDLSPTSAIVAFALASALFFVIYFVSGIQNWGWLFPAFILAALAGTIAIVDTAVPEEWIATLILGSVAVPFLVAFLLDRSRTWALVPAFILVFIAIIPGMSTLTTGEWLGALIVAVIGLPFIVVYMLAPNNWWAIIPGGFMVSIAAMILLTTLQLPGDEDALAVVVMFLGWAATFGILWLRRSLHDTDWAKYPALALTGVAVIMALLTLGFQYAWAVALILLGIGMVLYSLRKRPAPVEG